MGHSSDIKLCKVIHNACSTAASELNLTIEEANAKSGSKRVVVLSNDTDVVVRVLNH